MPNGLLDVLRGEALGACTMGGTPYGTALPSSASLAPATSEVSATLCVRARALSMIQP